MVTTGCDQGDHRSATGRDRGSVPAPQAHGARPASRPSRVDKPSILNSESVFAMEDTAVSVRILVDSRFGATAGLAEVVVGRAGPAASVIRVAHRRAQKVV